MKEFFRSRPWYFWPCFVFVIGLWGSVFAVAIYWVIWRFLILFVLVESWPLVAAIGIIASAMGIIVLCHRIVFGSDGDKHG